MAIDASKVAAHWSKPTTSFGRTRWWQSGIIVRHINERICGVSVPGTDGGDVELIRKLANGRQFASAVSVGCGDAHHELCLLKAGIVQEFHLYELSEVRIKSALAKAAALGLSDRVHAVTDDAFRSAAVPLHDLVYWKDALHHMPKALDAVRWSRDVLKPDGLFFMNDFVGPTHMQYTDRQLDLAAQIRKGLGDQYLADPRRPGALLPIRRVRPTISALLEIDPSECADSGDILRSVVTIFPQATIIPTGGIVYSLALSDVIANIDEKEDAALLRTLMVADDFCTQGGDFLYAVAYARRDA